MKCPKCGYENKGDPPMCDMCHELLRAKGGGGGHEHGGGHGHDHSAAGAATAPSRPFGGGAAVAGGEPVVFTTSGRGWSFPSACACCLGPQEEEVSVTGRVRTYYDGGQQYQQTTFINVPMCNACIKHLFMLNVAWWTAAIAGLGAGVWLSYPYLHAQGSGSPTWGNLLPAIIAGIVVLVAGGIILSRMLCSLNPGCAGRGKPIQMCGPADDGTTVFTFKNPVYGMEFMRQNSGS